MPGFDFHKLRGAPVRYSVHVNGPWCLTFGWVLGVSRQALHAILAERASITPEMAVRLGKLCGNGPGIWLGMQQTRDLWMAERSMVDVVARIPTMRAKAA